MSKRDMGWWAISKGVARAILEDRTLRRRFLMRLLAAVMLVFAVGLWGIDGWLEKDLLRFALWWLFCGGLAVLLFLFGAYDAVAVVREERERFFGKGRRDD